jgi:hypothetical protein
VSTFRTCVFSRARPPHPALSLPSTDFFSGFFSRSCAVRLFIVLCSMCLYVSKVCLRRCCSFRAVCVALAGLLQGEAQQCNCGWISKVPLVEGEAERVCQFGT